MSTLIEGRWDCRACGNKGIKGSIRECTRCGKPRDKDTRFYMTENRDYVSPEKASTINRNPDWICSFCSSLNSANKTECAGCGASVISSNNNYLQNKEQEERRKREEQEKGWMDTRGNAVEKLVQTVSKSENIGYEVREENTNFVATYKYLLAKVLLVVLIIIGLINLIGLFTPKNRTIEITELNWERTIRVEKYQPVEESDWNLPRGVKLLYTTDEIHHYDSVIDHYVTKYRTVYEEEFDGYDEVVTGTRDLGNGYFEEITTQVPRYKTVSREEQYEEPVYIDVPVYRTKYHYRIHKWLLERIVRTSGINNAAYWGEVKLKENEREGEKFATYSVKALIDKDKTAEYSLKYEEWQRLKIGDKLYVKVHFGGRIEIIE